METLFVVEQHKNQYCSRSKSQGHARFGGSPSRGFRDINCRTFESGRTDILPTPLKTHGSPKTPPPNSSDNKTHGKMKVTPKSAPISINGKSCRKEAEEEVPVGGILLSELWAGPTYSNSPPPSSLPIPKFSVRPKRTVSLDLPGSSPEIEMRQVAKSAPSSPSREHSDLPFASNLLVSADSATKTLRRILNLNINDD